ncbi:MAG: TadE family protein, partial [Anaerolineae bacterium]
MGRETGGRPPLRHMVVCGLDRFAECRGPDSDDGGVPADSLRKAEARRPPAGNAIGQELVEFAILLPLLLLIAFGVLDLGRALHASITITNAAREGARYAMLYPSDVPAIVGVTQAEAQGSGLD